MAWTMTEHQLRTTRPGADVAFEDPDRHPGWRLVFGYDHRPPSDPAAAVDPRVPFEVQRTSVTVERTHSAAPELTPSRLARLNYERAVRQADRVAFDLLSVSIPETPALPVGYPFRGAGREDWYRGFLQAVDWYRRLEGLSAMDAYRRIAERKDTTVGTVKRWAYEARKIEGASS
jgi:hypothetical protein